MVDMLGFVACFRGENWCDLGPSVYVLSSALKDSSLHISGWHVLHKLFQFFSLLVSVKSSSLFNRSLLVCLF